MSERNPFPPRTSQHTAWEMGAQRLPRSSVDPQCIDFVGRMCEAWDQVGRHPFVAGYREHRALLAMAGLDVSLLSRSWNDLQGYQRQALIVAARQMVELGRHCAWVFGEGDGA